MEYERLDQRTRHDVEMLREVGMCPGIENYSRHIDGRKAGQRPYTLIDYFPKDFLTCRRLKVMLCFHKLEECIMGIVLVKKH